MNYQVPYAGRGARIVRLLLVRRRVVFGHRSNHFDRVSELMVQPRRVVRIDAKLSWSIRATGDYVYVARLRQTAFYRLNFMPLTR